MAEKRRDQQKLWLILFQIKAIRGRVNSLAAQFFAFSTLAVIVASAAAVVAAALLLGPLAFLVTAALIAIAAFAGVVRITRTALRSIANPLKAAAIADERAGLKGRLTTVLLTANVPKRSGLWPYLLEDTYGRRNDFEPRKIEPRWLSNSIAALLGACLLALLLIPLARLQARGPQVMGGLPGRVTADVGNLDIRPADPALEPNVEVYADEATMRKLAEKLASEQAKESEKGALSQWMNKARNLAGNLQNEIAGNQGQQAPSQLKLTDRNPGSGGRSPQARNQGKSSGNQANNRSNSSNQANGNGSGKGAGRAQPPVSLPPQQADQLAQNSTGFPGQSGSNAAQSNPSQPGSLAAEGSGGGGGESHGAGTDPQGLFGPEASEPLGSDNFKITIDAQPSDESSSRGAPAYIPPKVRVPLADHQSPDEPIARASVPANDQMTIKRVFER
ncbi:MAG TPA: hypothetical protein VJN94_01815 [Candidatus Binataceae bacterium]|nr:hypothetical protein [Candidatus Binataceae bacterium]